MVGCIMFTGIRLPLQICPFIFSFFFLSSLQALEFFVTFFSGTVRPRMLKPGTHMDNGECIMYTESFHNMYTESLHNIFLQNCEA